MKDQKKQLEQQLWNIANTLIGKMDADDCRDYILGFFFYKYLSKKTELQLFQNVRLIVGFYRQMKMEKLQMNKRENK